MSNFYKIIKKHSFKFFLLILSLIPLIWFLGKGNILITGLDTNFPLDPLIWFKRRFFVWNGIINAGADFSSSTSGIFFHLTQVVPMKMGLSLRYVEIFSLVFWFSLVVISSYILSRLIFPKNKAAQVSSVVFYSLNTYLFNTWENIKVSNLSLYIALPIFISILFSLIKGKIKIQTGVVLLSFSSILVSGSGINPAYFSVIILSILIFGLFSFFTNNQKRKVLEYCGISISILILTNSFWLIPLFQFLLKSRVEVVTDLGFTNWLQSLSENTSLINVMRLQGAWDWYSLDKYGMPEYLPYTLNYLYNVPFIVLSFFPAILSVLSLLFFQKNKKFWYIFFGFLMLLGIFLGSGSHPPAGELYLFLSNHLPFFSFYRSPWYIFTPFLTLSYAFLIGLFIDRISTIDLSKKYRNLVNLIFFTLLFSYGLYNYPLITGKIFRPSRNDGFYVKFPDYVFQTKDWLESKNNNEEKRIITYPDDQLESFTWGYRATESILSLFSDREIITPSFNIQSGVFQKLLEQFYNHLKRKEYVTAFSMLNIFSADTIFYKKDASTLAPKLTLSEEYGTKKQFGEWEFLEVPGIQSKIFSPERIYMDYSGNNSFVNIAGILGKGSVVLNGAGDTQTDLLKGIYDFLSVDEISEIDIEKNLGDSNHYYSVEIPKDGSYKFIFEKKYISPNLLSVRINNSILSRSEISEDSAFIILGPIDLVSGVSDIEITYPVSNNLVTNDYKNLLEIPELRDGELPNDFSRTLVLYNSENLEKEIKIPVSSFNPFLNYVIEFDYKYIYGSVPIVDLVQSSPSSPIKTKPMDIGSSFDWQHVQEVFDPVMTDSKFEIIIKLPPNKEGDKSKTYLENIYVKRIYNNSLTLVEEDDEVGKTVPNVSFVKKSPVKYEITVSNASDGYILAFLESFSKEWTIERIKGGRMLDVPHFMVNGYANGWYIPSGESNQQLIIRYKPQRLFILGVIFSTSTLLTSLILYFLARRRKK